MLKLARLKLAGEIPTALSKCRWLHTLELQDNREFTEWPQWRQPEIGSFDNVAIAMLTGFEIAASEGWPSGWNPATKA